MKGTYADTTYRIRGTNLLGDEFVVEIFYFLRNEINLPHTKNNNIMNDTCSYACEWTF